MSQNFAKKSSFLATLQVYRREAANLVIDDSVCEEQKSSAKGSPALVSRQSFNCLRIESGYLAPQMPSEWQMFGLPQTCQNPALLTEENIQFKPDAFLRSETAVSYNNYKKDAVEELKDDTPIRLYQEWDRLPLPQDLETATIRKYASQKENFEMTLMPPQHVAPRVSSAQMKWIEDDSYNYSRQLSAHPNNVSSVSVYEKDTDEHESAECSVISRMQMCKPVSPILMKSTKAKSC